MTTSYCSKNRVSQSSVSHSRVSWLDTERESGLQVCAGVLLLYSHIARTMLEGKSDVSASTGSTCTPRSRLTKLRWESSQFTSLSKLHIEQLRPEQPRLFVFIHVSRFRRT